MAALPLWGLDSSSPLSKYARQTWQTESGLPQATIHAIIQTHDGYLWLGTDGGLVRFDGLRFAVYDAQNTPALKSNNIRSLLEDRGHALWIGTAEGLTKFDGLTFQTFTTSQGLPNNGIWSIFQSQPGKLWVLTADGLASLQGDKFKAESSREGARRSGITVATEGIDGTLWLGTQDGLVGEPIVNSKLPGSNIEALLTGSAGHIWIGTHNGLAEYDAGRVTTYTMKDGLPGNRIGIIYQDREHNVWVSTDGGLARISNGKIERLSAHDPLSDNLVLSMLEDREGNLWLGTESGGLTVLRDTRFTTYTSKEGLTGDAARCVFQDSKGSIWVGTSGGGLNRFDGNRFSNITAVDGLSSNVILALDEDTKGSLLVGTPDGLNVLRNAKVTVLTSADGLADDFVRSIYADKDGSVWLGTRRGLSHWTQDGFKTYTQADGLGSDFVGALWRDANGVLWVGTRQGLSRLAAGKFRTYTTLDGLSSNVITAIQEDPAGSLWIGTQDGGLNRISAGKITSYIDKAGLPDVIYGLLEDARQNLWVTSKPGIFRISKKDFTVTQFGTADGLRVSECSEGGHPAAWKTRDGSLWFAMMKGVAAIDARRAIASAPPPPVVVETVLVDERALPPQAATDIAPGPSRLAFEYAGLNFSAPQRVRFRYRLQGFDKEWTEAGTRRIAYYTNIPPGSYKFQVTARANDSAWNEDAAVFAFRLRPHFYRTYWFYLLVLLSIALLCYAVYRARVREVEARFAAVLAERNRIAREIHDTLAQGFVAISVQLELISRKLQSSPEAAKELINQTRQLVQSSLEEARRSIWELRSQGSEAEDLPSRISKMAAQVTATSPLKVQFTVMGSYRALPGKVENELLKIGQEAVTNVVRHAGARNVAIDLKFDDGKVKLTIADDGRGFAGQANSSGPDGHFGLRGMRERADQIGAGLNIKSTPGEGTEVTVEKVIQ